MYWLCSSHSLSMLCLQLWECKDSFFLALNFSMSDHSSPLSTLGSWIILYISPIRKAMWSLCVFPVTQLIVMHEAQHPTSTESLQDYNTCSGVLSQLLHNLHGNSLFTVSVVFPSTTLPGRQAPRFIPTNFKCGLLQGFMCGILHWKD